ncbi:tetratricopeptide repeat protein [Formosa undariae]|uniref:Tetratricopeptide repeat protein n=1 Tax=Formosa undariae TaxID=1325436 RepID=A0ABV5EZZ5_9FLAO
MKLTYYLTLCLAFFTLLGFSQNMQEGFTYLETGKYEAAESFFKTVLEDHPNNKTARLCYGRAIGLHNNPEQAETLFENLLNDFPNDFEVKLNYGESLLWNSKFEEAKSYFKTLIIEDPKSFPALLSYANTLSNLKLYEDALTYVNKALAVSPGNPNALTSKKYIYLGYAYQQQQAQNYDKAEHLLLENLTLFKEDADTQINLANLYLIANRLEDATAVYQTLEAKPQYNITGLNGLALVAHLNEKDAEALEFSKQAFSKLNSDSDVKIKQATTERYIQALIWNRKYTEADTNISSLIETHPNENWVLALRATLNIYKSDFKKSVTDYNRILVNDSTSFDGNLGKANALKALGYYDDAYISAENTLSFYKNQKDASQFIKTLNTTFTPSWETKSYYSFDNGDNKAYAIQTGLEIPTSTKLKWLATYGFRSTSNKVTDNEAQSNNFALGLSYQILPNITFKGLGGITDAKASTNDYTHFVTDVSLNIKPYKLQVLDLGYKREIQNFNAELLDREIVMNHAYANYNLSTNFKLGWFTQYFYTWQSDENTRNLLFTSLYYNLFNKPALKVGLNYQYITFKNQVPDIYFSPESFNAFEIFANVIKNEETTKPKSWFYELTAATGLQYIEDDSSQITYRIQGKLGYKFTDRALINLYGTQSNIASATAAGFNYTEIGLRFKWYLFDKPLFRK